MFFKKMNATQNVSDNANKEKKKDNDSSLLSTLHDLTCLISGVLLVFSLLFRVVVVSGPSMKDTLLDGDWLFLVSNVFYTEPKAGDVIVASKDSFDNGSPIIKRVIATEGQTVDIDFTEGKVYVDGNLLEEPYVRTPTNLYEGIQFPIVVEDGCVFAMGDNRNESKDSRSTDIGQIDKREILGRAVFLLIPGKSDSSSKRDFTRMGAIS